MSEWISVEDRLPKTRRAVLVWVPHNECYYLANFEAGEWTSWQGNRHLWWCDVLTHWMPLPNPPESRDE